MAQSDDTAISNNFGEGVLDKVVEEESHIATALLGHFVQYYPQDQKVIDRIVNQYRTELDRI